MPYLHWEKDRQRARFTKVIRKKNDDELLNKRAADLRRRFERKQRTELDMAKKARGERVVHDTDTSQIDLPKEMMDDLKKEQEDLERRVRGRMDTFFDVVIAATKDPKLLKKVKGSPHKGLASKLEDLKNVEAHFRRVRRLTRAEIEPTEKNRKTVLFHFLLGAAALFEKIAWHDAEEMIRETLWATPQLHPRRTLDQAYYWTMKSTDKRDRDQVVYRATTPLQKFMHHPLCKRKADKEEEDEQKHDRCWQHIHCWKTVGCEQCRDDIRKRSCIVMVDQLWLWILDGSKSNLAPKARF